MTEKLEIEAASSNVLDLWPGLCTMIAMAVDDDETIDTRRRSAAEGARGARVIAEELLFLARHLEKTADYDRINHG